MLWLVEVKPAGPVQPNVKGPVPVGVTVKLAEPPGQTELAGVTAQLGGAAMLTKLSILPVALLL